MKRKILFILLVAVLSLSTVFGVCSFASDGATSATAESAEAPKAEFFGAALVLDNAIKIRYMVNPENVADNNDLVLLVWTEAQDEYTLGSESYKLDYEGKTMSYNGKVYPVFDFNGVGAKRLADDFYAVVAVKTETGYTYSAPCKYGVLQYAYNKLGKTGTATGNEALKILIKEMLEYGAASQNYLAYKTDRLASDDFYQVKVAGGSLSDGFNSGLYLEGEKVTIKAPDTDGEGATFSHWTDSKGNKVSSLATYELTVGTKNEVYTPIFVKYSVGLEFDSNGDGTCYVVGMGECNDTDLVIPPSSSDKDTVIGIDSSAFAYKAITSVSFPSTIEEIGRRAFNGCASLTDVYYDGTEDEWNNNVSISTGNDAIENATKHFNVPPVVTFTVTFVDYDGSILKTETVESGKSATAPADPVRDNYTFVGWDKSFDNVAEDMTVTAKYERIITSPSIIVSDVIANASDGSVDVVIDIANNPGISSLKFDVAYDEELTLSNVVFDPDFGAYVTAPTPYSNPQTITCISPLAEITASGTFATLTFNIDDTIKVDTVANIIITLHQAEIYDENFDPVVFEVINGTVTIQAK